MKGIENTFTGRDGESIYLRKWESEGGEKPRGVVQIAHGMAEHIGRYDAFAKELVNRGFVVYGSDHRGHGKTAGAPENIGYAGENGFEATVDDMAELTKVVKTEYPELPVFLFGHSMGSFLSRRYIQRYGEGISGVILSGTAGDPGLMGKIGLAIVKTEMALKGKAKPSPLMKSLTFGGYNKGFKPERTEFDWLSRDEKVVDDYINDPLCGGTFSIGFFHDLLKALLVINSREHFDQVPKELPMYLLAGDQDPVGNNAKGVLEVYENYKNAGVKDITSKLYKESRHEILNEKNREEVFQDVIAWLEERMAAVQAV